MASSDDIMLINEKVRQFKEEAKKVRGWIERDYDAVLEKLRQIDMLELNQYQEEDYWSMCREFYDKLLDLYVWGVLTENFDELCVDGETDEELGDDLWLAKKVEELIIEARDIVKGMKYRVMNTEEEIDCPICMEELDMAKVTPCSHSFHSYCLFRCLTAPHPSSGLCPMCRSVLMMSPLMEI